MKMKLIQDIGCVQLVVGQILFAAPKCQVQMLACNAKIEKRRGNFCGAIFRVNVQFFYIQNNGYLLF